jgi:hypothetical protein
MENPASLGHARDQIGFELSSPVRFGFAQSQLSDALI